MTRLCLIGITPALLLVLPSSFCRLLSYAHNIALRDTSSFSFGSIPLTTLSSKYCRNHSDQLHLKTSLFRRKTVIYNFVDVLTATTHGIIEGLEKALFS